MTRRHLLKLALVSLAGLAVPASAWRPLRADALFRDLFGDDQVAAHLGRMHQGIDQQAGARGRSLVASLTKGPPSQRGERLHRRVQADLAALDVVTIDGWVLARSEADLCAAVSLERGVT